MTIEERLTYLEQRQKLVEEEVAWLRKDLISLITFIENLEIETHYHITYHFHTGKEDNFNNLDNNLE